METLLWRAESSWRVVVAYFRAKWSHSGSDFITEGGTPCQWVLVASPSCPCRLTSISAKLLCQAKRQRGRCARKGRNEPKQQTQPQLSAQTAPVSARSHPVLFFASNTDSQLIPPPYPPPSVVGNPKTIITEWERWKGLSNHLFNSCFSPRPRGYPFKFMIQWMFAAISIKEPALSYLMHSLNTTLQILFCNPCFYLVFICLICFYTSHNLKMLDDLVTSFVKYWERDVRVSH